MSIQDYEVMYNLLFIVILIFVCSMASLFTVWLYKKALIYWLYSSIYFVGISITTIFIWYLTVGITLK